MENRTIYNSECENNIIDVTDNVVTDSEFDTDESDFDRLLDEFIKSTLEEDNDEKPESDDSDDDDDEYFSDDDNYNDDSDDDDPEDEFTGYDEYKYGNVEYKLGNRKYILPGQPENLCKAEKLEVTYADYEEKQLRGEPLAFVYDADNSRTYFTLHGVTEYNKSITPTIYVYAESNPYPVCRYAFDIEAGEKTEGIASLVYLFDEVAAGNYFFYLWGVEVETLSHCYNHSNGGYFIPFVKVYNDDTLSLPGLDKVDAKVGKNRCSLALSLRFDSMLDKSYAYSFCMYSRGYNLVASSAAFAWDAFGTRKRKNFNALLTAANPFYGEYSLYIMQNGKPLYKIQMFIDKGKIVSMTRSVVKPFGSEYLMLVRLEKRSSWHLLREMSAPVTIKEYFLSAYTRQYLGYLRKSNGLNTLSGVTHFIYNGGSSKKELRALDRMSNMFPNVSRFESADCINLTEAKNAVDPYGDAAELFDECRTKCIALYNISALANNGTIVVKKMLDAMEHYPTCTICLIGNTGEVTQLFECYPQLKRFFPGENCISAGRMYADTLVTQVIKELKECDLVLSPEALTLLMDIARNAEEIGSLYTATEVTVSEFVKSGIVENFVARTMATLDSTRVADKVFLSTVEACDINKEKLVRGTEQEFQDSIKELNEMVGLNDVKQNIITTFNRLKNNAERRRLGLKVKNGECHHMIFTGNPGTGKTTVAKMMGRIYRALGILSKGEVVYTDRSKIVGRYIGDTERNMQRLLQEAKGNILFIDEAYTLCDTLQDRKDYGYRAIECLLTVMAQENCDMIVIFAGYAKEMGLMMQSNQGLNGRFPYKFEFKDYTADELMQIAEYKLSEEDYELTDDARALLHKTIVEAVDNKGWSFSNARWIEQYVNNGIIPAQSDRLIQCCNIKSRDDYRSICVEDVRVAYAQHKPSCEVKKVYREIGFTA
ncbi:MAG: AAA family ATPase [Bacteroidaceae bacterium]|nr:AAA family ATPase [Bacteroidaceae bacterium]